MIRFENPVVIFVLILLAAVSSWGIYLMQSQNSKDKIFGHYPDNIGITLRLSRYDKTGFLSNVINADKASHYPDSKTTTFQKVLIQVFNHQNNPPWIITAPSGVAYGKGETIQALGQVHMQQNGFGKRPASQIDTENVNIYTSQKMMATEAPVTATQPGSVMHAVGATYDYDKNILKLLSNVQVNYQPQKK